MKLIQRRAGVQNPLHIPALVAAIILASVSVQPASATGDPTAAMNANDPGELRLNAFQKYLEGDLPGATELYTHAIRTGEAQYGKNSSFVADLCYEVGTIALEDGQFQNAESFLGEAVKRKPNSVMARVKYADLLTMRGQQDKAFNQIQAALKVSPGSPIAQQAMVKWMMSQASHRTAEGAVANVAATWECFRLRAMGQNSVQATIANISSWRNSFVKPKAKPAAPKPVVAVVAPPKEPVKPKAKAAPPPVPKPKVAKIKPVEKPVVAKAKPAPVETVARVPEKPRVEKPPVERHVVAVSAPAKKSKNGLVPPPPPGLPVFGGNFGMVPPPPPASSFGGATLNTSATKIEKPKEKKKPKPAPAAESAAEEDPEYLLEWAEGDKKKH